MKVNFVFKSPKGGVFTEKWEFLTQPRLLSGASLILTLRGIAIQEDRYKKTRAFIEVIILLKTLFLWINNNLNYLIAKITCK